MERGVTSGDPKTQELVPPKGGSGQKIAARNFTAVMQLGGQSGKVLLIRAPEEFKLADRLKEIKAKIFEDGFVFPPEVSIEVR